MNQFSRAAARTLHSMTPIFACTLLGSAGLADAGFSYDPITETILSAQFELDVAGFVAHRSVFDEEVNFIRLSDGSGNLGTLDLSDDAFGAADWPSPAVVNLGDIETAVISVEIDSSFFAALAGGNVGLLATFTDTDDGIFAIDYIGLRIETQARSTFFMSFGGNDGYGLGIADFGDLPGGAGGLAATGTGFDEGIASMSIIPAPGALGVFAVGGLWGRRRRQRKERVRRCRPRQFTERSDHKTYCRAATHAVIWVTLLMTIALLPVQTASACDCEALDKKFWKLANEVRTCAVAVPTQQNRNKVNNLVAKMSAVLQEMDSKLKNMPGWTPPIPDSNGDGVEDIIDLCTFLKCWAFPFNVPPYGPFDPGAVGPLGGGRGGGLGGLSDGGSNALPGTSIDTIVWARNNGPVTGDFHWDVVAVAGNPAGFTISPMSGTVEIGPQSYQDIPITVSIDAGVAPGTVAFFDVFFIEGSTGFLLSDQMSRFSATAAGDITVTPVSSSIDAPSWGSFSASWTITNHTPVEVTKEYELFLYDDPSSIFALNDGTIFSVRNVFMGDGSTSEGAASLTGSITIAPNSSATVGSGPLFVGEYCGPQMVGGCGLSVDGMTTPIQHFHSPKMPPDQLVLEQIFALDTEGQSLLQGLEANQIPVGTAVALNAVGTWGGAGVPDVPVDFTKVGGDFSFTSGNIAGDGSATSFSRYVFHDLVGTPLGGSVKITVSDDANSYPAQVLTSAGDTLEEIIDAMALTMIVLADTQPGYHFGVKVVTSALMVMTAPDKTITFESLDPGLTWKIDGVAQETDSNGSVELTFVGDAIGPALIKATIPGTEFESFAFLEVIASAPDLGACPADMNADGVLDLSDITTFLAAFLQQEPVADLTADGTWDLSDITFFISAYSDGCP